MIRMYRRDAQLLLMALLYLKSQGVDMTSLVRFVEQHVNEDSQPWTEVFWAIRNEAELHTLTIDDLINQVSASVRDHRGGVQGDANLVDAIVEALQLPYTRNVLGGRVLSDLRRAVLVPSEAIGLADRLRKKELNCASCGRTFNRGELAIAISDGGTVFYCHQCTRPDYVACDHAKCNEPILFSKVYARKHPSKGVDCGHHKPEEVQVGPGDADQDNLQAHVRVVNRLRQAADRLRPLAGDLEAPPLVWNADPFEDLGDD